MHVMQHTLVILHYIDTKGSPVDHEVEVISCHLKISFEDSKLASGVTEEPGVL